MQVMEKEPRRPRSLDRTIDRDLETICLNCLEKEPAPALRLGRGVGRRPGTLADRRADRARRVGAGERAVKWARRRPAVAALLAAPGATLVGALVGGVLFTLSLDRAAATPRPRPRRDPGPQGGGQGRGRRPPCQSPNRALLYAVRMPTALAQIRGDRAAQAETLLDKYLSSDLRGWEWWYLKSLCHPEHASVEGSYTVAWSPDGKRLATATPKRDGVRLLDATDGETLLTLRSARAARSAAWRSARRATASSRSMTRPSSSGTWPPASDSWRRR